jgi:outer membrane immunogenic protein
MKIIRAALASAALCAMFAQAGNAADDPAPAALPPLAAPVSAPIYSWAGIYMGVNAGYGATQLSASGGGQNLSGSQTGSGLIAGGQLGVNYQFGRFVAGWELDEQWSNQRITYNLSGTTVTDRVLAFGTARVRGGVAMDRVLFYLTGGGAYVARDVATSTTSSVRAQGVGFVGGAGVEGLITPNVTLRAEYLYMQTLGDTSAIPGVTSHLSDNIFRVGANYKLSQ